MNYSQEQIYTWTETTIAKLGGAFKYDDQEAEQRRRESDLEQREIVEPGEGSYEGECR